MFLSPSAFAHTNQAYITANNIPTATDAYLENGICMVHIRSFSEIFHTSVQWDATSHSVSLKQNDSTFYFTENSLYMYKNNTKLILNAVPVLKNGKFYVPIRAFENIFGLNITWNHRYSTVNCTAESLNFAQTEIDKDNLLWLARIVHAESEGESFYGKIAVANVVLNRVKSKYFPNTIKDVIFDTKYGIQFTPVLNGTIYNNPANDSILAAKYALYGINNIENSLYFLNPRTAQSMWIINNRSFSKTIGNHDFYC